jgi:hypothetical protein
MSNSAKPAAKIIALVGAWFMVFASGVVAEHGHETAEVPSQAEMWQIIQQQQKAIQRLEQKLRDSESALIETSQQLQSQSADLARTQADVGETREQLNMTADAIDTIAVAGRPNVSIGGYGEVHYNNLDSGNEIDIHRFVVFLGHEFNQNLKFFSEVEIEHSIAGEGKVGEVELEQAYVQWDYKPGHNGKAGVFLLPVGILNETHEPDTFYGVERNPVEKNWTQSGYG